MTLTCSRCTAELPASFFTIDAEGQHRSRCRACFSGWLQSIHGHPRDRWAVTSEVRSARAAARARRSTPETTSEQE